MYMLTRSKTVLLLQAFIRAAQLYVDLYFLRQRISSNIHHISQEETRASINFATEIKVKHLERRGCTKGWFLVPAKPIHILCVISFRYCPFVIENLALTGLRFGTFGALKVFRVTAYKPGMMTLNRNKKNIVID